MNENEFRLLDEIEDTHWWFVGKQLILRSLLERHAPRGTILDLGCGTGGTLRNWMESHTCFGTDRSDLALRICAEKGFTRLVQSDLGAFPFAPGAFDTILALDVIEHLEDDVGFVARTAELLSASGQLILAVPAFQMLWSQHDETFQHFRRYRASQLRDVVEQAGMVAERITYTNTLTFPPAMVWRLLSQHTPVGRVAPKHDFWPVPRWLNTILTQAYRIESRALSRMNLPFGVSVVCVARPRGASG